MIYRIHPGIGIARVGDSDEYYIEPSSGGGLPQMPDGRPFTSADFRDGQKRIRRQGARFQVYAYESEDSPGTLVRPGGDVHAIQWTVHLANKKATWYRFNVNVGEAGYAANHPLRNPDITSTADRQRLIIDPGPRSLTGPNQWVDFSRFQSSHGYPMNWPPTGLQPSDISLLGGLRTDGEGNLIVLGGFGRSGSSEASPMIVHYANNDRWWDDTADGPVTALLIMKDGSRIEVDDSAWVIVAPPKFAPQLENLVTLYDTMFDTAVRQMGIRPDIYRDGFWQMDYLPSWADDIEPILRRAQGYRWVAAIPRHPHNPEFGKLGDPDPEFNAMRTYYFEMIRSPEFPNDRTSPRTGQPLMPFLCGDNCLTPAALDSKFATVTRTQYFFLQQWANGRFVQRREELVVSPGTLLDRAALDNCVGAAFSPGIEMTWLCRNPALYSAPFRIRRKRNVTPPLSLGQNLALGLEPGDLTRYMAIPWQADFNECSSNPIGDRIVWWWPVQRPNYVYVKDGERRHQVPWLGTAEDQNALDYIQFADDLEMVKLWNQLGFVFDEGTADAPDFVEVERLLPRDPADD